MGSKINKLLLKDKTSYKIVVLDSYEQENEFLNIVATALNAQIDVLEFDGSKLSSAQFLSVGRKLRDLTGVFGSLLIIKERIDIAKLVNADGICFDDNSIPVEEAAKLIEGRFIVGFHAKDGILPTNEDIKDIDYVVSAEPIACTYKYFKPL